MERISDRSSFYAAPLTSKELKCPCETCQKLRQRGIRSEKLYTNEFFGMQKHRRKSLDDIEGAFKEHVHNRGSYMQFREKVKGKTPIKLNFENEDSEFVFKRPEEIVKNIDYNDHKEINVDNYYDVDIAQYDIVNSNEYRDRERDEDLTKYSILEIFSAIVTVVFTTIMCWWALTSFAINIFNKLQRNGKTFQVVLIILLTLLGLHFCFGFVSEKIRNSVTPRGFLLMAHTVIAFIYLHRKLNTRISRNENEFVIQGLGEQYWASVKKIQNLRKGNANLNER